MLLLEQQFGKCTCSCAHSKSIMCQSTSTTLMEYRLEVQFCTRQILDDGKENYMEYIIRKYLGKKKNTTKNNFIGFVVNTEKLFDNVMTVKNMDV